MNICFMSFLHEVKSYFKATFINGACFSVKHLSFFFVSCKHTNINPIKLHIPLFLKLCFPFVPFFWNIVKKYLKNSFQNFASL